MKKICFITAARSEYGLLKWIMKDVEASGFFEFQLVVTGGHLSYEQGHTVDQIEEEGFEITRVVDIGLSYTSKIQIAESMGRMLIGFAETFGELQPDYIVVLGDRYELLPICNAAFVMGIPIIHISGGDVTQGAIDDGIRNSVTMLAQYHFPGTEASAQNIIRMRGSEKNVWPVGEPGLDAYHRDQLLRREELAICLGLDIQRKWILMTYHPETKKTLPYNLEVVKKCIEAVANMEGFQVVVNYANADFGGKQINEYIEQAGKIYSDRLKIIPSLGHLRYLSFMKQVCFVLGNSSGAIVEAPFMRIPVINIGDRQKGRYFCANIRQCDLKEESLPEVIDEVLQKDFGKIEDMDYWGDGHASERILKILHQIAESTEGNEA